MHRFALDNLRIAERDIVLSPVVGVSNTKAELVQARRMVQRSDQPTRDLVVVCHEQHHSRVSRVARSVLEGHLRWKVLAAEDILLSSPKAAIWRKEIDGLRRSVLYEEFRRKERLAYAIGLFPLGGVALDIFSRIPNRSEYLSRILRLMNINRPANSVVPTQPEARFP